MEDRIVTSDPRDLWYLALPTKLTPKQVIQILRAALGGDLWQQWQLLSLMLDSWPMFRKCSHEVRQAVSQCRFTVHAYAEEGEEPSKEAQARAALVRRAIRAFRPNPFTDERGWSGMIYNVTDSVLNGVTMTETMWREPQRAKGGGAWEILPRASAWVHPRNYTFGVGGEIAVYQPGLYQNLSFNTKAPEPTDPNKFICAQFMSRSGSSLGAGLMRPLAQDWVAFIYGQGWLLPYAQKWGNPFLDATYKPGTPVEEINKLEQYLAKGASQSYVVHVDGTEINVNFPPSMTGNAIMELKRAADEHCQLVLLGQTATTQGTPGKLGAESEQGQVKTEMVQGCANWAGGVLAEQFASAVLRLNYGDDDLCPTIQPDFSEEADPTEIAARDKIMLDGGVPMIREEFYKRNNMQMPEEGDDVIVAGQLGTLADTEQELGAKPEPPSGFGGDPDDPEADPNDIETQASLARASDEEFQELRAVVKKAKLAVRAGHVNGEWEDVKKQVKHLRQKYVA